MLGTIRVFPVTPRTDDFTVQLDRIRAAMATYDELGETREFPDPDRKFDSKRAPAADGG